MVLHEIGRNMGGYVRGTLINAAIMGVLAWIGLQVIGVPFALVLGVLTMLGELVPILGPVIVGAIVAVIALGRSLELAIGAVVLYTVLIQVEGHVLTPNIMRRQTNVPQTLVLFAIVVGAGAGGLLGVIVSVPVAAAFRVFVLEVLAPWERRLAGAEPRPPAPADQAWLRSNKSKVGLVTKPLGFAKRQGALVDLFSGRIRYGRNDGRIRDVQPRVRVAVRLVHHVKREGAVGDVGDPDRRLRRPVAQTARAGGADRPSHRAARYGLRGTRGCCRADARCRGRTSSFLSTTRWGPTSSP